MQIPDANLQISANAVAWYGAIVATFGAFVSLYNAWCDRSLVIIDFQKGMKIINAVPPYSEDKEYFIITVINKGRRPVALGTVAFTYNKSVGAYILPDSSLNQTNRVLTEQNPETRYLVEQDSIDFNRLNRIQVYDRTGKQYNKYYRKFGIVGSIFYTIQYKFKKLKLIK
jgi:hypothetical protein